MINSRIGYFAEGFPTTEALKVFGEIERKLNIYSICKANGNTGNLSIAGSEVAIVWANPEVPSSDVSVSGSTITIQRAGTYRISVTLRVTGDNRVELFVRTFVNGTENVKEQASNYSLRDADQNTGGVTLATALSLQKGDTLEFRGFADADGACTMLNSGTRATIERVAD